MPKECIIERLTEPLEDKINRIVENATISRWNYPSYAPDLVLSVVAVYYLTATNGKKCIANSYALAVIDVEEQKQTYAEVEEMKYHKMCNAKKVLRNFIQSQFKKRTGLLSHRGYFKFIDIENMK